MSRCLAWTDRLGMSGECVSPRPKWNEQRLLLDMTPTWYPDRTERRRMVLSFQFVLCFLIFRSLIFFLLEELFCRQDNNNGFRCILIWAKIGQIWLGDERDKSTRERRNAAMSRHSVHVASCGTNRWERAGR